MRTKLGLVLVVMLFLSFCSESVDESNPVNADTEISEETFEELNGLSGSTELATADIDTSLFDIVLRDKYGYCIYLWEYKNFDDENYFYKGIYINSNAKYTYLLTLNYNYDKKTLICNRYKVVEVNASSFLSTIDRPEEDWEVDNIMGKFSLYIPCTDNFTYLLERTATNYFSGIRLARDAIRYSVDMTVIKGEFPGMND